MAAQRCHTFDTPACAWAGRVLAAAQEAAASRNASTDAVSQPGALGPQGDEGITQQKSKEDVLV